MTNATSPLLRSLAIAALAFVAGACGTTTLRPVGHLGDQVNSPQDDYAPWLRADARGLYFTSKRAESEDIYAATLADAGRLQYAAATRESDDIRSLSQRSTNDGAIALVARGRGFFASAHAPDSLYAHDRRSFGGIVGGTDLFEFDSASGRLVITNLGTAVNSSFWDSHPAAAARGDSLVLVFASDRPAGRRGHSSPFRDLVALSDAGEEVTGNSDLWYAFRIGGVWGPVTNLSESSVGADVNSRASEYSPFLHCIDHAPRLFFASRRAGSLDLYEAPIAIDFARRTLTVGEVAPLPSGADAINSEADEWFPYLEPSVGGREQHLYFASNRDQQPRATARGRVQSAGGYDLYAFPLERACTPPVLRYHVTLLDAENPSRPVPEGLINLYAWDAVDESRAMPRFAPLESAKGSEATFELEWGRSYSAFGGSAYRGMLSDCNTSAPIVDGYQFIRHVERPPIERDSVTWVWLDTIERGRTVTVTRDTLETTVIGLAPIALETSDTAELRSVVRVGDSLLVTRRVRRTERVVQGGEPRKYKARVVERIVEPGGVDTLRLATPEQLAPSERVLRWGHAMLPLVASDTTIHDTIYVVPRMYHPPICTWSFTRRYANDIPYFQTCFWEVNTSGGLADHLRRFGTAGYDDAGFIELHASNQYWGRERIARRPARQAEYASFARQVDRNLDLMAQTIAGSFVPEFLDFERRGGGTHGKLIVQVMAFSDFRPIARGYYIGDTVDYVSARYDTATGIVTAERVVIAPGTSLVCAEDDPRSNDTLSRLRAWYGFAEIEKRLRSFPQWQQMLESGEILMPRPGMTAEEYREAMSRARIIVTVSGEYADRAVVSGIRRYSRRSDDYYDLDDVRRIEVRVARVDDRGGRFVKSGCCSEVGVR